jgi:uncharacterized membrane protein YvbJ
MFLEKCKDCGKKVSIRAKVCPKCGVATPTKNFSSKHPKCLAQDCNEYAIKGFNGMCIHDYKKEKNSNANKIIIAFFLFFIIGVLLSN